MQESYYTKAFMEPLNQKITQQLIEAGVNTLYLFGSRAQGVAHVASDFDFGVLLNNPMTVQQSTQELYDKLYLILTSIVKPQTREADVIDIVFLDSPRVSLEIKSYIIREGKRLLDVDPSVRANVESRLLLQSADFAPLRKEMSQVLLTRASV